MPPLVRGCHVSLFNYSSQPRGGLKGNILAAFSYFGPKGEVLDIRAWLSIVPTFCGTVSVPTGVWCFGFRRAQLQLTRHCRMIQVLSLLAPCHMILLFQAARGLGVYGKSLLTSAFWSLGKSSDTSALLGTCLGAKRPNTLRFNGQVVSEVACCVIL